MSIVKFISAIFNNAHEWNGGLPASCPGSCSVFMRWQTSRSWCGSGGRRSMSSAPSAADRSVVVHEHGAR